MHSDAWLDAHAARAAAAWEERGGAPGTVEMAREGAGYEVDRDRGVPCPRRRPDAARLPGRGVTPA